MKKEFTRGKLVSNLTLTDIDQFVFLHYTYKTKLTWWIENTFLDWLALRLTGPRKAAENTHEIGKNSEHSFGPFFKS